MGNAMLSAATWFGLVRLDGLNKDNEPAVCELAAALSMNSALPERLGPDGGAGYLPVGLGVLSAG